MEVAGRPFDVRLLEVEDEGAIGRLVEDDGRDVDDDGIDLCEGREAAAAAAAASARSCWCIRAACCLSSSSLFLCASFSFSFFVENDQSKTAAAGPVSVFCGELSPLDFDCKSRVISSIVRVSRF